MTEDTTTHWPDRRAAAADLTGILARPIKPRALDDWRRAGAPIPGPRQPVPKEALLCWLARRRPAHRPAAERSERPAAAEDDDDRRWRRARAGLWEHRLAVEQGDMYSRRDVERLLESSVAAILDGLRCDWPGLLAAHLPPLSVETRQAVGAAAQVAGAEVQERVRAALHEALQRLRADR